MSGASLRKRPCKICRKWFRPDPRSKGEQKVCGDPACQRERNRRACRAWRKKNPTYDRVRRAHERLARSDKDESEETPILEPIQAVREGPTKEVIGVETYVVIELVAKKAVDLARSGSASPKASAKPVRRGGPPARGPTNRSANAKMRDGANPL